jgi:PAS domain S-box-containing protein
MDGADKYRLLFETMRQGAFYQSADGTLTDVNQAALELTGLTREEFLGRTSFHREWKIIDADGNPLTPQQHPSMVALNTGKPVRDFKLGIFNYRKNSFTWAIVNAQPCFREHETKPYEVVVTIHDISEQTLAEDNLRKTERAIHEERELLKVLFQSGPVAYSVATHTNRIIVEINDAWAALFGYSGEEVTGRPAGDFDFWANPEERIKAAKELQEKGRLWDFEFTLKRKSGEHRFVSLFSATIERSDTSYFITVLIDLTTRKKAEADLDRFFQMLPDLACIASTDGYFRKLNNEWERVLGFAKNEMLEQPLTLFIHPEDREPTLGEIERQVKGEGTTRFVNRYRTRDESYRWLEWNGTASPDGNLLYAVARDITDHVNTVQALKDSEIRFREFFNNISSGVAIYEAIDDGKDFIFKDFNQAAERIDRCRKEDVIGKSIFMVRPGIVEFGLVEALRRVYQTGIPEEFPAKFYKDKALQAWYQNYLYKLPSGELVAVFTDITERKQVEEEIITSRQALEDLNKRLNAIREEERTYISRELHDQLGQSLTAMKIDLNALLKRHTGNPEDKVKIGSLLEMVSDSIRDVQRISSDLRPEILYDLGLVPAMEWFTEAFEKRTGIACSFEADENEYADSDKNLVIFRILQESLTNVIRHANATTVSVRLYQTRGRTVMTVRDNGTGMEAQKIKSSKSLGILGMRERARQLGGSLEIASAENKGTSVTITLP